MEVIIHHTDNLKSEISRLKVLNHAQQQQLLALVNTQAALLQTVSDELNRRKRKANRAELHLLSEAPTTVASRLLIPAVLTGTIFRHSNFMIKTPVRFVSSKAAGLVKSHHLDYLQNRFHVGYQGHAITRKKPHTTNHMN
jgi:hypothetical protein